MRTIPPMIIAIIFFRGIGPGKLAGALALTVYTSGTLTKMYSEIIENVNKNVEDSIRSTGAKKIGIYVSGLYKETYPSFIGILLYRLESNIRNSTILGIIGAGGIGTLLNMNIIWRNWENVGLIVVAIGLMIGTIDILSKKIRMRVK
jgi:phosphonate transport system permease protein